MIKTITNRLFLLVTMLLLSTVNALAQNVAKIGDTEYATLQAAFDAAQDGDEVILLANLTQDDGVKFDREGIAATLDLNGKTFTVNNGSNLNNRAIRIDNGTLTVNNGKIIAAGAGTTSADGTGCYGAFRVEANGKLVANDLELQNARPWGLNVKVLGGEAELTNVTINSSYGGGIEVTEADLGTQSKAGKATLTGCTFTQTNYYDHCSTPLSVSGGSELVVNSGTYRGENHVLYVFSSGGYVTVNGGQFIKNGENNKAAFIAAIDTNTYPAYTGGLKLNNGQFTGNFEITSPASTVITGGTYSVDPTEFVADGYKVVDNGSGTYTVKKVVAQIGDVEYTTLQEAFDAVANGETITLLADLTQDDGVLFDRDGIAATLDLNGKTFTVNSGSNLNSRAIRIDNGTLTVNNGKIIAAGAGTTSADGTGCYGAFRVEANGKLVANDLELQNARPWGLNVKVLGGEAELTNVTINSSYGGGIEVTEADLGTQSKAGKATLTGCTFTQTNYYDHCSTPLSVSGGSELVVNSGTYRGENHVLYVFSSGGYVTVNGGQFIKNGENNKAAFIAAIDTNTYPAYTGGLKLNAGNFTGNFSITSPASTVITGGTYSVDPTAYVAAGYEAVNNKNGTWTVSPAAVAQIGSVKYTSLEAAVAAATSGQTIELLADVDLSSHARSAADDIILTNITLDLNGKTIRGFNNGVRYSGTNAVIKNGTFNFVDAEADPNYGLSIGSYTDGAAVSDNMTIEDVHVIGGVNVDKANVTFNNVNIDMTDAKFYALWADEDGTNVVYNSGTINYGANARAIFGVAKTNASLKITGGTINTGGKAFRLGGAYKPVEVSGGLFDVQVPDDCCAAGYETVAKDDKWTVGKVVTGELTPETGATETAATYTVKATVQDAAGETLEEKNFQTVTVNIVTEAGDKKVASDAQISKLNMETVVAKAIAEAAADADEINVSIAVVSEEPAQVAQTYTYEVYPEATVTVNNKPSSTVKLANSDLTDGASFTFTLNVDEKFEDGATVKVVHKSADYPEEIFYKTVSGNKVSITVTHFSSFELSAAPELVPVNISTVGFATFSSTKAVDFTGIDAIHAYTATMNGKIIEFTRIWKVPANTGLLIRNPNGAKAVSVGVPVIDPADVENNYYLENNALVAVKDNIADGDLPDEENGYSNFILNKVKGVVGFYRPDGFGVDAGRAYLQVLTSSVSGVQSFTNLFDGETTAIDSITTADEQTQDNVFYDLSGRRVNNPQRGLYIVNGKKVLVK